MTYENLLVERDGAVAIVTINRPQGPQRAERRHASTNSGTRFDALGADDGVRAIVLTGAGEKAFVAGADINELAVQTPVAGQGARGRRAARLRPHRDARQAGHRRHQRLRARRRLRAGDGVHAAHRRRHRPVRPAGGQPGPHPRLRRHAAAAAAGRPRPRARAAAHRRHDPGAPRAYEIGLVNRVVPAADLLAEAAQAGRDAGRQGADRRALHPRGRAPRRRDAAGRGAAPRGDAVRPGRRPPTTCAKARARSSRSAPPPGRAARRCRRSKAGRRPPAAASRSSSRASTTSSPTRLLAGAREALAAAGVAADDIDVVWVPGAFESRRRPPSTWRRAARPAAVVCLGCLIRGETPHFEYIAAAAAHGITRRRRRHRRADGVRRAHHQLGRAGRRARRGRAGQQGLRGGAGGHRDGARCVAALEAGRERAAPTRAARWDEPAPRARSGAAGALPDGGRPTSTPCRRWRSSSTAGDDGDGVSLDDDHARVRRPAGRRHLGDARAALDAVIEPHCTNWRLERLAVLDRLVLRLAVREWLTEPATPPRGRAERGARAGPRLQRRGGRAVRQRRARRRVPPAAAPKAVSSTDPRPGTVHVRRRERNMSDADAQSDQRRANLAALEALGLPAYPHRFDATHTVSALVDALRATTPADDARGRRASRRWPPAASSASAASARPTSSCCRTAAARLQVYVRQDALAERDFAASRSCSTSATSSASRATCSAPRPTSCRSGPSSLDVPRQVLPAAAREVARAAGRRDALPPALPRPDRQSRRRAACSRCAAARWRRSASS